MRVLVSLLAAALVLASAAAAGSADFQLRRVAQTGKTVTVSWTRQPGADGYEFLRDGVVVSRTFDRSTTTATFWKGSRYAVTVLHRSGGHVTRGKRATYISRAAAKRSQRGVRLVFVAAPKVDFELRLVSRTPKTVTFSWKRQPGADGYQFMRNGTVVSRTFDRSTTTATFWKGTRYAVHVLRKAPGKQVASIRRAVVYATVVPGSRGTRLVSLPAPEVDFQLHLVSRDAKTVTFAWKPQPGADGYRFLRNGVVVSKTFDRRTTRATFWKGSRYAVEVLRKTGNGGAAVMTRALAYTSAAKAASPKPGSTTTPAPGTSTPGPTSPGSPAKAPSSSPPPTSGSSPGTSTPPPATSPPSPPPATPAPAPPPLSVGPGGTLTLSGSYSPSAFFAAVALAPPGPVTVNGRYTITGDLTVSRESLRITGATVSGKVDFGPSANGSSFVGGSARGFAIFGADNVLVEGSSFDGQGQVKDGAVIWDEPAGNAPSGWVVRNNTFSNFYIDNGQDVHSQAIYVGYSSNGLVEGNTFTNNGSTSHIFFTWFGNLADPATSYPRNVCVRGNTFGPTHGAYYDVNFRAEIPTSANISIQRDATNSDPEFYGSC